LNFLRHFSHKLVGHICTFNDEPTANHIVKAHAGAALRGRENLRHLISKSRNSIWRRLETTTDGNTMLISPAEAGVAKQMMSIGDPGIRMMAASRSHHQHHDAHCRVIMACEVRRRGIFAREVMKQSHSAVA